MKDENTRLPGLSPDEIDQLINPHLSIEERLSVWKPKPLSVQARKVLKQRNFEVLRHHYRKGMAYMITAFLLWVAVHILPTSHQVLDMLAVRLCLFSAMFVTLIDSLLEARAMNRAVVQLEKI